MRPKNKWERNQIANNKGMKRAKGLYGEWSFFNENKEDCIIKESKHLKNTTKVCSESCCGNPRRNRWGKTLTIQERQALEAECDNFCSDDGMEDMPVLEAGAKA